MPRPARCRARRWRGAPPPALAGRRRGLAEPRPGWAGGAGARGIGARARTGQRGTARRRPWRPRRWRCSPGGRGAGGGGAGQCYGQREQANPMRAAAWRGVARARPATAAAIGGPAGGGMAVFRRRPRRKGREKGSGSTRGARESSSQARFGLRVAGGRRSTSAGEAPVSGNGGRGTAQSSSWRGGTGAGQSQGARGAKDSSGGGEWWPEQRRRRALLTLLDTSSKKEKKGRGKRCWAPRADKDSARRARIAGARDAWSHRCRSRYGRR